MSNIEQMSEIVIKKILDNIYPFGYVYVSTDSSSPQDLFGGIWRPIKDKFLLGSGANYSVGDTGGESEHTLTNDEIPSHHHELLGYTWGWGNTSATESIKATVISGDYGYNSSTINNNLTGAQSPNNTQSTGENQAHNNMPPYLTVYMWRKIGNSDNETFEPAFTADNPASVSSGFAGNNGTPIGHSSSQVNGVWSFTNSWLTDGWCNSDTWEVEFDLRCIGLRYISLCMLIGLDTDGTATRILSGWEGPIATNPAVGTYTRDNTSTLSLLNGDIWSNPSTPWVHIKMTKTGPTSLTLVKTNDNVNNGTVNYTNMTALEDYDYFTIGAGNNGASGNFESNKVEVKNFIAKAT